MYITAVGIVPVISGSVELKPHSDWRKRESIIYSVATMRVLSVLRHWVTKYPWVRSIVSSNLRTQEP